jgi:quercetin dioxygenase-like cupin family protein
VRPHQPGQAAFRAILAEEIEWKPFAAFPPEARLAVLVGHPLEKGLYMVRVRLPHGVKLMPHRHPEDRIYTVISGVFYIGLGDEFEADKLQAYPPGAVIVLPGNTWHFHWAKSSDYITQVTRLGHWAWNTSIPRTIRGIRNPACNERTPSAIWISAFCILTTQ